jgi:hypothetical protein
MGRIPWHVAHRTAFSTSPELMHSAIAAGRASSNRGSNSWLARPYVGSPGATTRPSMLSASVRNPLAVEVELPQLASHASWEVAPTATAA